MAALTFDEFRPRNKEGSAPDELMSPSRNQESMGDKIKRLDIDPSILKNDPKFAAGLFTAPGTPSYSESQAQPNMNLDNDSAKFNPRVNEYEGVDKSIDKLMSSRYNEREFE